jgi:hypothetical protein
MRIPSCPEWELVCQDCRVPLDVGASQAICPSCGRREFDRLTCHHPATETVTRPGRLLTRRGPTRWKGWGLGRDGTAMHPRP